jgi:hypothetical protein
MNVGRSNVGIPKGIFQNLLEVWEETIKSTVRISSPQPSHESDIGVKPYQYVNTLRKKSL